MHPLLQNDFFVIGVISFFALLVNRHEIASAIIYSAFCWVALFACKKIPPPDFLILLSDNHNMVNDGWVLLLSSLSSIFVIALIYAVRQCMDGLLPRIVISLSYIEILLHITCFCLLLNGMSWMSYNWAVLANQLAVILLFIARGGYGRTILRTRLFRDFARSH